MPCSSQCTLLPRGAQCEGRLLVGALPEPTLTQARAMPIATGERSRRRVNGRSLRRYSPAPIGNTPPTHHSGQGLPENGSCSCGLFSPLPSSDVLGRGLAGAIRMDGDCIDSDSEE